MAIGETLKRKILGGIDPAERQRQRIEADIARHKEIDELKASRVEEQQERQKMLKGEQKLNARKYVGSLLAERKAASRQKKLEAKDFEKPAGERIKSGLKSFGESLTRPAEPRKPATSRKAKGRKHKEPSVTDEVSSIFSMFASSEPKRKSRESSVSDIIPVFGNSSNYSSKKRTASRSNDNLPYFANTGQSNYDFFFNNKKSRKPKSLLDL